MSGRSKRKKRLPIIPGARKVEVVSINGIISISSSTDEYIIHKDFRCEEVTTDQRGLHDKDIIQFYVFDKRNRKLEATKFVNAGHNRHLAMRLCRELKVYTDKLKEIGVGVVKVWTVWLPIQGRKNNIEEKTNRYMFDDAYIVRDSYDCDLGYFINVFLPKTCETTISRNLNQKKVMNEVIRVVQLLHSSGIVHMDLRPSNFVMDTPYLEASFLFRLRNFGYSKDTDEESSLFEEFEDEVLTEDLPIYGAPEVFMGYWFCDEKADVWSIGCIFAEFLTGKPFLCLSKGKFPTRQNFMEVFDVFRKQETKEAFLKKVTKDKYALDLLGRLLEFKHTKRISLQEARTMYYLKTTSDASTSQQGGANTGSSDASTCEGNTDEDVEEEDVEEEEMVVEDMKDEDSEEIAVEKLRRKAWSYMEAQWKNGTFPV